MDGLSVPDYHDFLNAVSPSPTSVPGHASFDVGWARGGAVTPIHDATFGFSGRFVPSVATIRFAVSDDGSGVVYSSDDSAQVTVSGGVGYERNGVFFDDDEPSDGVTPTRVDRTSRWSR